MAILKQFHVLASQIPVTIKHTYYHVHIVKTTLNVMNCVDGIANIFNAKKIAVKNVIDLPATKRVTRAYLVVTSVLVCVERNA